MELLNQLTQNLGVTEEQARDGTGLIMKMARENLGIGDFNKVADTIPGIENIIKTAPELSGTEKALGVGSSAVGGGGFGNLADLTKSFSQLGLDSQMATRFVPIVLSFVQSKGGDVTRNILERVLK